MYVTGIQFSTIYSGKTCEKLKLQMSRKGKKCGQRGHLNM
jgi:hypothetical protein